MLLTFIEKLYHLITCFTKIKEKQKMNVPKVAVGTPGHIDWGNPDHTLAHELIERLNIIADTPILIIGGNHHGIVSVPELMDRANLEMGVITYLGNHHHDTELMHGITKYCNPEKNIPIFIFHNREEEIQEMRKSLLVLAVGHILSQMRRPIGEILHASIITRTAGERTGFGMRVSQHRKYPKVSARTGHILPLKLKVPRGIHRDNHGRPQPQKLTSARLKGRNGSRK